MARPVTVATMISCGSGVDTVVGVYSTLLRTRKGVEFWDLNHPRTERVGTIVVPREGRKPGDPLPLFAYASRFETPRAPAFDFGRTF